MNRLLLQGLLSSVVVLSSLTASVIAMEEESNVVEPMCKKGKVSVFQKSTQTFRSYKGELCKIPVIAKWVLDNCKDEDELFEHSNCQLNAEYALKNITPKQKKFLSFIVEKAIIEDPQDASDLMELAKKDGALSSKDMNIWQKYKLFFPKPSPKPFIHFKR